MASQDSAASFEAMIHAGKSCTIRLGIRDHFLTLSPDRARKKNEDLANQIFGRSKSSQNVNKKQKQQEPRSPSLASRMGVQKVRLSSYTTTAQTTYKLNRRDHLTD